MPKLDKFSQEMKQNIKEFERILSESSSDPELPPQVEKKLLKMETTITKANAASVDCNHVDKKLVGSRCFMLAFQELLVALDDTWVLSGLGHKYGISNEAINKAVELS
uniref:Probable galacturonosyltransferase 7 isoform X2 n=1 Tax=Tanacetum cinerariifolium TaxID=118510 RepID=A0A699JDP9_TANCI|nr:probable galacturonosyltransferase 7 isoform X2 [Tanacetum cinerariifolium]